MTNKCQFIHSMVGARKQRPKSATQRAVEEKVFSLLPRDEGLPLVTKEDQEEEVYAEHAGEEEEYLGGLDNYLNFDDEDFDVSIEPWPFT